jgi:hypothetical protein
MFMTCLFVLVGALVAVALSILIEGRALVVIAWALTATGLLAVVVSWGSLTAQAFPTSRFASHHPSVDPRPSVGYSAREDDMVQPALRCAATPPSGMSTAQARPVSTGLMASARGLDPPLPGGTRPSRAGAR